MVVGVKGNALYRQAGLGGGERRLGLLLVGLAAVLPEGDELNFFQMVHI